MREEVLAIGGTILFFVVFIVGILWIANWANRGKQEFCENKYGSSYYFKDGGRGTDFCANEEGEVRYPRSWRE